MGVPPPMTQFDDVLLGIASKHQGIQHLLCTIFDFFERKTDLFHVLEGEGRMGFPLGVAEEMVLLAFRQSQHRYAVRAQPGYADEVKEKLAAYAASKAAAPKPAAPKAAAPKAASG